MQHVSMRTVQCCARVRQCNLTPPDKIRPLQCAGIIETEPFTSNEAIAQSNQHQSISCQFQLCIILH